MGLSRGSGLAHFCCERLTPGLWIVRSRTEYECGISRQPPHPRSGRNPQAWGQPREETVTSAHATAAELSCIPLDHKISCAALMVKKDTTPCNNCNVGPRQSLPSVVPNEGSTLRPFCRSLKIDLCAIPPNQGVPAKYKSEKHGYLNIVQTSANFTTCQKNIFSDDQGPNCRLFRPKTTKT